MMDSANPLFSHFVRSSKCHRFGIKLIPVAAVAANACMCHSILQWDTTNTMKTKIVTAKSDLFRAHTSAAFNYMNRLITTLFHICWFISFAIVVNRDRWAIDKEQHRYHDLFINVIPKHHHQIGITFVSTQRAPHHIPIDSVVWALLALEIDASMRWFL